jgi:hypothetical protein
MSKWRINPGSGGWLYLYDENDDLIALIDDATIELCAEDSGNDTEIFYSDGRWWSSDALFYE